MKKTNIFFFAVIVIFVHVALFFCIMKSDDGTTTAKEIQQEIAGKGNENEDDVMPATDTRDNKSGENKSDTKTEAQPVKETETKTPPKAEPTKETAKNVQKKDDTGKSSEDDDQPFMKPYQAPEKGADDQAGTAQGITPPHGVLPPQTNRPLPKAVFTGKPSTPKPAANMVSNIIPIKLPKLDKNTLKKYTGIMVDLNKDKILWQSNANKEVQIASLTKMMTLMLCYEKLIESPKADLKEEIEITREARGVPPSGVGFKADERSFPLDKLMLAAAVKSANDAAFLIAQHFGNGKASAFVSEMNSRAKELGMKQTKFYNPHGLPEKAKNRNNTSTVTDLVYLVKAYLTYPQLHDWSSKRIGNFRVNGDLVSSNHLLRGGRIPCKGVTGIKTGFTNGAGFCIATICERNGRTLLLIITGFNSSRERDEFARAMFDWGFKR